MRTWTAALALGVLLMAGTVCSAATIEPVQGQLTINQGQGFQAVNGRMDANVGDSVMVSPDGAAVVSYPDGCNVNVQPGAVMTIAPLSPCASGSYAAELPVPQPTAQPQLDWGPWVIGGVLAGTLGFIVYEITRTTPSPASP